MKIIKKISLTVLLGASAFSCNNFLEIVPDNIATIEHAFNMRSTAERFLFTCYSYIPALGSLSGNPAHTAGDEFWLPQDNGTPAWQIARGNQNVVNSYMNYWQGNQGAKDLYEGIRQCNIFLDNIERVPDMTREEKDRWTAEAKFLKGYYHFWLTRMYGPIAIIRENIPVAAGADKVYPARAPVSECFDYAVELMDESLAHLPDRIETEVSEMGRITKTIALSMKAYVLVTAASPLFNGNSDYAGYQDPQGTNLFDIASFDPSKWERALAACREAVEQAEAMGHRLYTFRPEFFQYEISDTIRTQMSIRNAVAEKWNQEIIWGNTLSLSQSIQADATPRGLDPTQTANSATRGLMAPPLKLAELFYTDKGLPITADNTWAYGDRYNLKIANTEDRLHIKEGYTTVRLHYNREPRFYASLGFDGGIWYGQGRFNDKENLFFVSSKKGQPATAQNLTAYSVTGYWPKKLVNFNNVIGSGSSYTIQSYPFPMIRLADLYLLYAEALNEVHGPGAEVFNYLNLVRERAGIPDVEDSWTLYSNSPGKIASKEGMREIIQQERLIELAFEGQRYWDLRRWKKAGEELNKPIVGWDLIQEDAPSYYRPKVIFQQKFSTRDYFWPLPESELLSNKKMNQNPGW